MKKPFIKQKIGDNFLLVDGFDEYQEEVITDPYRAKEVSEILYKMMRHILSGSMSHKEVYIRIGIRPSNKQLNDLLERKKTCR